MRKYGQFMHILITAGLGIIFWALTEVLFFGFGRLIFDGFVNILPSIVIIILHFALFCGCMFGTMHMLCKARGDYKGWADRNLLDVVSQNYKKAAIALIAVVLASGVFEFLYELEVKQTGSVTGTNASSYVFIIDDSSSMRGNDPSKARVQAVRDIMDGSKIPYAVYSFSTLGSAKLVKPMGKYSDSDVLDFPSDGSQTYIVDALKSVVADVENGTLNVGNNPQFLILSDGDSFDDYENSVVEKCNDLNITVNSISYTLYSSLLKRISDNTGGTYSDVYDAALLKDNMQSALKTGLRTDRNLLGDWTGDLLHAIMRVVMLSLLGLCWSWMKQKAYCCAYEHKFADTVFFVSLALTVAAAILVELLFRFTPVPAYVIRLIFCILWAITPGIYWAGMPMQNNNMYNPGAYTNQGTFGNYDKIGF